MIKAVIFDCDGVLVDSEPVYARAFSSTLEQFGHNLSPDYLRVVLQGKSMADCYAWLAGNHGVVVTDSFQAKLSMITQSFLDNHISAVDGIHAVVASVTCQRAVASNGIYSTVVANLKRCQLARFFDHHIYTADIVDRPKPAPDLYLYVSDQLGVTPNECLVIEDSPLGAEAGLAAGMDVCCITHGQDARKFDPRAYIAVDMNAVLQRLRYLELC